jgi:hypothetical protein
MAAKLVSPCGAAAAARAVTVGQGECKEYGSAFHKFVSLFGATESAALWGYAASVL